MRCNIDAKGKAVRLVCGAAFAVAGLTLAALVGVSVLAGWWVWVLAGGMIISGSFQIYEGLCGWCALRALGFRTPI